MNTVRSVGHPWGNWW